MTREEKAEKLLTMFFSSFAPVGTIAWAGGPLWACVAAFWTGAGIGAILAELRQHDRRR
jgi:hypothetical protein